MWKSSVYIYLSIYLSNYLSVNNGTHSILSIHKKGKYALVSVLVTEGVKRGTGESDRKQ